jgi:hypothetical protein
VDTFEKKMDEKIAAEKNEEYGDRDLEEMGTGPISEELIQKMAEKLSSVIAKLEEPSEDKPETKIRKKKLQTIENTFSLDFSPRKKKYNQYREVLGERRSFSKTDTNLTAGVMILKEMS